ncbi:plastocyanin/azurin family copper-binding protein [Pueribacillus sp. YX66]|uniref:plastocyanin/azurin family copper-binding protein n=1 Tax=Pueribacillus sp. YX66 TaxID=3229242 RepID=UPI00358D9DAC
MSFTIIIMLVCSVFLIFMLIVMPLKRKISHMAGMMAAMSVGMTIGLLVGTILGVVFKGDLFLSTVLGMMAGAIGGGIAGIPFNSYAVVDGVLSGVMGGMMGAMLGEMIAPEQSEAMVKIMFVLFVCSQLTMFYILSIETEKKVKGKYLKFIQNPALMAIGVVSFFYLFNQLPPLFDFNGSMTKQESQAEQLKNIGSREILISTIEYSYQPSSFNIDFEETVTIKLLNNGEVEHDLEIVGLKAELLNSEKVHKHHDMQESVVHIHAKPGEEVELTFKSLQKGRFSFYCTIPGHKEAGMIGTVNIL